MSKENPFAAAMKILHEAMEEAVILGLDEEIASIDVSLAVLEAAGGVDKERDLRVLATLLKVYVEADGMLIAELEQALEDGAVKEIRALLEAIPDKVK
jgi:DNA-binding transcriptional ArsR family regulator